jgi:hypothetical protein
MGFFQQIEVVPEVNHVLASRPAVCAICSEAFQKFYSNETDDWMYDNAIKRDDDVLQSNLDLPRHMSKGLPGKCRANRQKTKSRATINS